MPYSLSSYAKQGFDDITSIYNSANNQQYVPQEQKDQAALSKLAVQETEQRVQTNAIKLQEYMRGIQEDKEVGSSIANIMNSPAGQKMSLSEVLTASAAEQARAGKGDAALQTLNKAASAKEQEARSEQLRAIAGQNSLKALQDAISFANVNNPNAFDSMSIPGQENMVQGAIKQWQTATPEERQKLKEEWSYNTQKVADQHKARDLARKELDSEARRERWKEEISINREKLSRKLDSLSAKGDTADNKAVIQERADARKSINETQRTVVIPLEKFFMENPRPEEKKHFWSDEILNAEEIKDWDEKKAILEEAKASVADWDKYIKATYQYVKPTKEEVQQATKPVETQPKATGKNSNQINILLEELQKEQNLLKTDPADQVDRHRNNIDQIVQALRSFGHTADTKISGEEFNTKWATLKSGESLVGPDGKTYTKR